MLGCRWQRSRSSWQMRSMIRTSPTNTVRIHSGGGSKTGTSCSSCVMTTGELTLPDLCAAASLPCLMPSCSCQPQPLRPRAHSLPGGSYRWAARSHCRWPAGTPRTCSQHEPLKQLQAGQLHLSDTAGLGSLHSHPTVLHIISALTIATVCCAVCWRGGWRRLTGGSTRPAAACASESPAMPPSCPACTGEIDVPAGGSKNARPGWCGP